MCKRRACFSSSLCTDLISEEELVGAFLVEFGKCVLLVDNCHEAVSCGFGASPDSLAWSVLCASRVYLVDTVLNTKDKCVQW